MVEGLVRFLEYNYESILRKFIVSSYGVPWHIDTFFS